MGIYKNVMELLVEEEVGRQFKALPERISAYVNQVEWVAYALNQLPPLYATSEKGLRYQIQRGKAKHGAEIRQAVQRALAAIGRDPLRTSTPLQSPQAPLRKVLTQLRFLLRNDQIEWDTLPLAVEKALELASRGRVAQRVAAQSSSASTYPNRPSLPRSPYYGDYTDYTDGEPNVIESAPPPPREQALTRPTAPPPPSSDELFGWDDPLYNPR
jgi:hypothetical protein